MEIYNKYISKDNLKNERAEVIKQMIQRENPPFFKPLTPNEQIETFFIKYKIILMYLNILYPVKPKSL